MRDPLAPVIEGYDLSGIVNPYSFQCTPFYEEGDNGGTLMDGTTIHDVLAAKIRLSWTLKALSAQQYADLSAALNSGPSLDSVNAYVFDPTQNAVVLVRFHVTAPEWLYAVDAPAPMSFADAELVLEEDKFFGRFVVTPPNQTTYAPGETLDLTGLTVTRYDKDGNAIDITSQCDISPADGTMLLESGSVAITVALPGESFAAYTLYITVIAEILASGDWWTLYSNGLLYIYCVGDMPDYYLPTWDIGSKTPWKNYLNEITRIAISNSVTRIGDSAFRDTDNLLSITIPDSVTSIGAGAFYSRWANTGSVHTMAKYTKLRSITIPDSVTSIGDAAFENCNGLVSVTLSKNITAISNSLFSRCSSLYNVTIPNGVTRIGTSAFYRTAISSITIPNSVTYIGGAAFNSCSLRSIAIPNGVTSIEGSTFYGATSLYSVTLPNSVTSIGSEAFYYCSGLSSITLPSSLITIGREAFGRSGLRDITIPGSVTSIGDDVFNYCSSLKSITFLNGVTTIAKCIVHHCSNLTSVTIPQSVTSIENSAFFYCSKLTTVTIPNSVTSIGNGAFGYCYALTNVTIPNSVTSIGNTAFEGCRALTNIIIPNSVTSIGRSAFEGCSGILSATISSSIINIENRVFLDCTSLASVTISNNIASIGDGAFSNCTNLTDVYYSGTEGERDIINVGTNNASLLNATWHYDPHYCNITFLPDGGAGTMEIVSTLSTPAYILPENEFTPPDGMQFKAWEANGVEYSTGDTLVVHNDITITALWRDVWVITFDANGGAGSMGAVTVFAPSYVLPQNNFTPPDNCRFKAWNVNGAEYSPGDTLTLATRSTTITVIWENKIEYTVAFFPNGGGGAMETVTFEIFSDEMYRYTLPQNSFTPPDNCRFKAWDVNGTEYSPGSAVILRNNATVTALWRSGYTITFDANGGTGTMGPVTIFSTLYTLPQPTFTAPSGGAFKAWSFDGGEYFPGDTLYLQGNATITALWEVEYIVTFDANGGTGTMEPVTVTTTSYRLPYSAFTPPSGYVFKSWNVNGLEYAARVTIELSGDTTVTAIWEEAVEITLTINPNNGIDEPIIETEEIPLSEFPLQIPLLYLPVPTAPDGYALRAWDVNGTEYGLTDTLTITENTPITFTALWGDAVEITITYNPNNGTEEPKSQTVEIPLPYVLPLSYLPADKMFTVPDGYHFKAWDINGTEYEPTDTLTITDNTPITFTAIWEEDEDTA